MIQNSLSPVVKSRISSSSGRTMSVEKRSLARTGTMSSFEYFTTRASASVVACAGEGWNAADAKKSECEDAKEKAVPLCLKHVFHRDAPFENGFCFWELESLPDNEWRNQLTAKKQAVAESREREEKKDIEQPILEHPATERRHERRNHIHGRPPASTSRPFSKPYVSKASFRFLLS